MVYTWSVAGDTGTIIIILKGETMCAAFNGDYISRLGLAPGSTIITTKNTFKTNDPWHEETKSIMNGYNHMPVIRNKM